jgi:hypothetical protein
VLLNGGEQIERNGIRVSISVTLISAIDATNGTAETANEPRCVKVTFSPRPSTRMTGNRRRGTFTCHVRRRIFSASNSFRKIRRTNPTLPRHRGLRVTFFHVQVKLKNNGTGLFIHSSVVKERIYSLIDTSTGISEESRRRRTTTASIKIRLDRHYNASST